jgi:hypothetical protein
LGEVNLEEKLINALEEIDRLREKNRKQKEKFNKYEDNFLALNSYLVPKSLLTFLHNMFNI